MPHPTSDKPAGLEALAQDAAASIEKQEAEVHSSASSIGLAPANRLPLALGLSIGLVVSLWIQSPSIREPFPSPDPVATSAIAEADLELIHGLISAFKISQGRLPENLDEIKNLPDSVKKPSPDVTINYQSTSNSYALKWDSPHWAVELNGATGKTEVKKKS